MTQRDKVAFALFAHMYKGSVDDDPTFPQRNWDSMAIAQKELWYNQADVAIEAMK